MTTEPRLSVVAVATCGEQVYVCRRQPKLLAFPGYHSFPGGKVDEEDRDEALGHPLFDAHPPRLMRALVRELQEEVAHDLTAAVTRGDVRAIELIGHAVTPPHGRRPRFDAHFFRIDFHQRPAFEAHASELAGAEWRPVDEWRELDRRGRLICVGATRRVFDALRDGDLPQNLRQPPADADRLPILEMVKGLRLLGVPSNTLPPADETNAFLIGDAGARRLLVDPSPGDEPTRERLQRTIDADGGIDEIFITHHHPDHRERANLLAAHWNVPLGMSAKTRELIEKRAGAAWFAAVPSVRLYQDGDVLTQALGEPVRALAVPGHDAGQMALMPDSRNWCIVGDLIQGVGTVVVGGEEGDMLRYFESLQRIIDLDPAAIVPSHGTVMGTTFRLKETLHHRRLREQQVLALHESGRSIDEMLSAMYRGTPTALLKLARMNIESHMAKLRAEGRIAA